MNITHDFLGSPKIKHHSYSEKEVIELLKIQRENCYVAIYNETLDENLATITLSAPEPGGGSWKK